MSGTPASVPAGHCATCCSPRSSGTAGGTASGVERFPLLESTCDEPRGCDPGDFLCTSCVLLALGAPDRLLGADTGNENPAESACATDSVLATVGTHEPQVVRTDHRIIDDSVGVRPFRRLSRHRGLKPSILISGAHGTQRTRRPPARRALLHPEPPRGYRALLAPIRGHWQGTLRARERPAPHPGCARSGRTTTACSRGVSPP